MAHYVGSTIQSATGSQAFSLPFVPSKLTFTVSALSATGAENDVAHYSYGVTDGTNSHAHSILVVNGLAITRYSSTYCLAHYAIVGGSTTRVISATLTSFNSSPNGYTLNFDRANGNYNIIVEAES